MSLSLLKAYDSSSEESDEEANTEGPESEKEPETADSAANGQFGGKNFFLDDSDASDDEDAKTKANQLQASPFPTSSVYYPTFSTDPSASTSSDQSSLPPLYGPPHPSQMYNYAGYDDNTAQSTSSYDQGSCDDPEMAKRRRLMTDEDVKKLIKKYECDTWNCDVPDQLDIVDANVDSHLGNVRENLLMNITKSRTGAPVAATSHESSKDGNKPGALAKRKHQITYLAYMAKANEEKLQNEWSKNKMTKRQTQAKYGF